MIAVADASPLCYLVLVGEIDLLPRMFDYVTVPREVALELLHEYAPHAVAGNPRGGGIDRLAKTNFRCSPAFLKQTLDRYGTRS